jgi:hypothetical protein
MEYIFGGRPLTVILRLVIISIIVGVVFSALGLTPLDLWASLGRLSDWLYNLGFASFKNVLGYFIIGAMVVFPIWAVYRVVKLAGGAAKPDAGQQRPQNHK